MDSGWTRVDGARVAAAGSRHVPAVPDACGGSVGAYGGAAGGGEQSTNARVGGNGRYRKRSTIREKLTRGGGGGRGRRGWEGHGWRQLGPGIQWHFRMQVGAWKGMTRLDVARCYTSRAGDRHRNVRPSRLRTGRVPTASACHLRSRWPPFVLHPWPLSSATQVTMHREAAIAATPLPLPQIAEPAARAKQLATRFPPPSALCTPQSLSRRSAARAPPSSWSASRSPSPCTWSRAWWTDT